MKTIKKIKTMKSKSIIAALLAVFTLGVTTSCEDMFSIDSNRVVLEHEINTSADSVYTTLGVLQCVRKVADRYVILGEARGDNAQIDEKRTKTSLRNLANFEFEDENEYLNVRDYYAVINNCNYALEHMDKDLKLNNKPVLMDEYAALLGIRAWTYLQLAINYGKVPYYTYPVVTEADVERAYSDEPKDIVAIAADLAPQLIPYLDEELPTFAATGVVYPQLRLVLAELYLWSGDYENAKKYYEEYFMKNEKFELKMSDDNGTVMQAGYLEFGGAFATWTGTTPKGDVLPMSTVSTPGDTKKEADFISAITMETSSASGTVSEVANLFRQGYLLPSASWKSLCNAQQVFLVTETAADSKRTLNSTDKVGDMRKYAYTTTSRFFSTADDGLEEAEEKLIFTKHKEGRIVTQRSSIACLRWAEAMNALSRQQFAVAADSAQFAQARLNAMNAFYLLKDAFKVFFPEGSEVAKNFERFHDIIDPTKNDLQKMYVGIHGRGTGDVYYDDKYYVLDSTVIAKRLGIAPSDVTFNDTVQFIDELIIDELALESTMEGNRFGDLIRFAKRRQAWGDSEYRDFLALRVANRGGEEAEAEERDALYNKLSGSEEYWYLPFK